MEHASKKKFPVSSKDYKLYEEVGEGVSATVYRALCVPLNQIVAIKVLDLEKCNNDLDGIRREVQTMSLIDHSNLLRAHCSFTTDHSLWVVMPYIAGGSCLHIMKSTYPEGFEEPVIATLLREVLKALAYLHSHGHIHRDVKAGNILIDWNGSVKLADFGVSACMFDSGDRQRSRNTFVGTPCWMAPEVMQQLHGYDFKADIWSFGITALELAHGHAPFSKYPPMKVLLMTLQNAPPGLDYERDRRFSKSFKELVAACLVKDPKKRPSAEKLLKHSFFKHGKTNDYLTRTILNGLSPLGDRFRRWKAKEADLLVNNKVYADKEHKSQSEYIRGISGWNFNLEDLRSKATLINDDDEISSLDHIDVNREPKHGLTNNDDWKMSQHEEKDIQEAELVKKVESLDLLRHGNLSSSFPVHPIEALRGYFDVCEDEINAISPEQEDNCEAIPEQLSQVHKTQLREDEEIKETNREKVERNSALSTHTSSVPGHGQRFLSGSLIPERVYAQSRVTADGERDDLQQNERNYSGPLFYRQKRNGGDLQSSASMDSIGDACEGKFIQHKGRFKVTSADVSLKAVSSTSCLLSHNYGPSSCTVSSSTLPTLQSILQQNILQRDQIMKVLKCVERASGNHINTSLVVGEEIPVNPLTSREQELQAQVNHLQHRINSLVEELQELKTKNFELEKQMKVPHGIEEEQ